MLRNLYIKRSRLKRNMLKKMKFDSVRVFIDHDMILGIAHFRSGPHFIETGAGLRIHRIFSAASACLGFCES